MKKTLMAMMGMLSLASPVLANEMKPITAGLDFEMPYVLRANGAKVNERGNLNLGVDGRYWTDNSLNFGARFAFDLETRAGSTRQITFAPGAQYFWMAEKPFRPYVRADLPILLKKQRDMAISGGAGVAWNLGETTGIERLALRYDFDVAYNFGLGNAVTAVSIDFFKIGFDYKF